MGHQAVQANDHIGTIQEKQWVIQLTHETYLDQLVEHSASPPPPEAVFPVVGQPLVGQPVVSPPVTAPPVVGQLGQPVPSLLSLQLQPDLNVLAQTLSPQALRYVHLGIQIGRSLLN